MKLTYANRSKITGRRLERQMPEDLKDVKVVLNLGNSQFDEEPYIEDCYEFINRTREIANCVNKKSMFEILNHANVPCLTYFDLEVCHDREDFKPYLELLKGNSLILRNSEYRDYTLVDKDSAMNYGIPFHDRYTYATLLERKAKEFRIIVFKGRIFRDWEKIPLNPDELYYHRENCVFEKVRYDNTKAETLALKAAKAMNMDLCGVDILINTSGEPKVIEVNSAMSLSKIGVMRLYNRIRKYYAPEEDLEEDRNYFDYDEDEV